MPIEHELREMNGRDVPFIADLLKLSIPKAWQWYGRQHTTAIALRHGHVVGMLSVRNLSERSAFEVDTLYVKPHFRRLGLARSMWETLFDDLPSTHYYARVFERDVEIQCTLRQFGFVCFKTVPHDDGSTLLFRRV